MQGEVISVLSLGWRYRPIYVVQSADIVLDMYIAYRVYKKELNRFAIALNFEKQLVVSSFCYMDSLSTHNVE
jgi:hypothetical protein